MDFGHAFADLSVKCGEIHAMIHVSDPMMDAPAQFAAVAGALRGLLARYGTFSPVFMRWFLSDPANQAVFVPETDLPAAVSVIGQPPLDGTKCALWLYMIEGCQVVGTAAGFVKAALPCGVSQLWKTALAGGSTEAILDSYTAALAAEGLTLEADCMRTWFFVHDVDNNYRDVVEGRNAVFARCGLTPDTHFIASTGIGGDNPDPKVKVTMDAVAVEGLAPGSVRYLSAPTHLNPTHQYGVAFERATSVDYPDRRHVLVSGTASIDNKGAVVHPGRILAQCDRMIENIGRLLQAGHAGWNDVMQAVVYLRDPADYAAVSRRLAEALPVEGIPLVVVLAPVCRPAWLVEMECMALV